jgi:hypothetical protein
VGIAKCAIGAGLLFSVVFQVSARADSATSAQDSPPLHAAVQSIAIENRGNDEVIVVLSRNTGRDSFYHADKLPKGGKAVVTIPDLPSLMVSVLRREEVKRAAERAKGGKKGGNKNDHGMHISLGLALGKDRSNRRKGGNESKDGNGKENQKENDEQEHHSDDREQSQRDDSYGRPPDQSGRDANDGSYHVLLSNMLGNRGYGEDRSSSTEPYQPPGKREVIDAGEGSGERNVNGVTIKVNVGQAEGVQDEPIPVGGGNKVAISKEPEPVNSKPPPSTPPPCFCGPDMTSAYIDAIKRAYARIQALPKSETGPWDGIWFLSRNASSLDERVKDVPIPNQPPPTGNETTQALCPSGACADLPGLRGKTMSLFGECLPEHVGNDIMYGYVGTRLGVPVDIQEAGGNYAQFVTYSPHQFEPDQSRAAYAIGYWIAKLEGDELTPGNIHEMFEQAMYVDIPYGLGFLPRKTDVEPALQFIKNSYPALADCPRCPADATHLGTLWRDWTKSAWQMSDGSKAYAPGQAPDEGQTKDE